MEERFYVRLQDSSPSLLFAVARFDSIFFSSLLPPQKLDEKVHMSQEAIGGALQNERREIGVVLVSVIDLFP